MKLQKQITAGIVAASFGAASVLALLPQHTAGAQSDTYERVLAGVRLNSKANAVLKAYGNPNDVVVGDVGIRETPENPESGTAATGGGTPGFGGAPAGFGGAPGGFGGGPRGISGSGGGGRQTPSRGGISLGGSGGSAPGPPPGFTPPGFAGAPGGFPGAPGGGFGGGRDSEGGFPGGGISFSGTPAGGGGVGQFGQTISNLTPQQETTWIYNRRAGKDVVSYEFLVGQGGAITQIRAIGYGGGNVKTRKGVVLGSTYKEVVQKYGYPEQQYRVGRSLIASYRAKNHVLFQFLNQRSQSENPFSAGNKVIAITIATVE